MKSNDYREVALINIDEEKISAVVSGFQVPVKPEVLASIDQLMATKKPDIEKISGLILSDVANDIANAMIFIGRKVKTKMPVEMLYTIGLFHNCGIPLLAVKYENYKNVLIEANTSGENFTAVE